MQVLANFEVTRIQFVVKDDKYASIEKCHLQPVNRSLKLFDLRIKLLQLPVTNALVKWSLLKRSNGYLPINQNYTVDVCKFMQHSNHVFNNFIYSIFKDFTNLNHTCPFNVSSNYAVAYPHSFLFIAVCLQHDIIVNKFPTRFVRAMDFIFIPRGDYAIDSAWYAGGVLRIEGRVKFTLL
ncbi:hypothetical protein KR093_000312 [Drosophila rubida]|uniref:Uncharacterized protein n=1 Tax=Drosophila rubida TaxID=30044 RepID=A0AAD4JZB3_9MUSC|nr:hypothetical protein KR093_000312 [Drosophila rubida]